MVIRTVLALIVTVMLTGCGSQVEQKLLVMRLGADPTYLNPILYTDQPSGDVAGFIFSGLFRVNEQLELEPDLCQSYRVYDNGKRYVFYLRRDVRWHDGEPFTAQDVAFTFDRIMDPTTNTVRRSGYVINGKPITWHVVDKYTIEARLPEPLGPFLFRASTGILPKHKLIDQAINTAAFNRQPIGTGPFKFHDWKSGQFIRLIQNNAYYAGQPKVPGILFKIIPDAQTAMLALKRQDVHINAVLPKDYNRYEKLDYLRMARWYGLNYTYLAFNLQKPLFADKRFRQAVAHAVDQQKIVDTVLQGFGRPAYYPSSPVSWAYPPKDKPLYAYNPERSHHYLESLGYQRNESGRYERNGQPISLVLATNQGNKYREKTVALIQQYLSEIGIDVRIQLMEWSALLKLTKDTSEPTGFDLIVLGWNIGVDPDSSSVWHSREYPHGFNFIGYSNPQVDAGLDAARQYTHSSDRKSIYHQIFTKIANDLPYLFLYHTESIVGVNRQVQGLSAPGPAGLMVHPESVYLTP
jgi:peptide/nickel transport system substrate-binding protein